VSPAAGALETNDPVLYVEFRKDGTSIDPGPWWAKSQSEKVRG
jgi:septal ring factor EnvC (AmiA/AmiB activator)